MQIVDQFFDYYVRIGQARAASDVFAIGVGDKVYVVGDIDIALKSSEIHVVDNIDGYIFVNVNDIEIMSGTFAKVRVVDANGYDLIGELV